MNHNSLEKHYKNFTPCNICNYKWKYGLNIVQFNCSLNNTPCFSGYFKEWADPTMELMAMCFCLLPVTGSDLNFLLHREEYSLDFVLFSVLCGHFVIKNQLLSKMASGISPPGQPGFKI